MHLKSNLHINRFLWTKQTVEIITQELDKPNVVLFDVGADVEAMKSVYASWNIEYQGFDIEPKLDTTCKWNIENPFPYGEKQADIITLLELIEHLDNTWMSIKNLYNALMRGGYLFIAE